MDSLWMLICRMFAGAMVFTISDKNFNYCLINIKSVRECVDKKFRSFLRS